MKQKSNFKKYIIIFWVVFILILGIPAIVMNMVANGSFGELPSFEDLENPKSNLASEIISSDGKLLGKYYVENRTKINYEDISPNIINALVATEDARFFKHSGVDTRSLFRVLVKTFLAQDQSSGGGSTITQQLAKMLFHGKPKSKFDRISQKLKEWIIAARLEKYYTKEEIIAMYLNRFDFINNAVGIKSAAMTYFHTTPDSMNIQQAAMLVGMAKNPALFNPVRRPDSTLHRRNVVLSQMTRYKNPKTKEKYLSKTEFDSIKKLPLELNFLREDHNQGVATYFREYLRGEMLRWCKENKKPDGTPYNIYKDGLKIHTTINYKMQQYAEQAVAEHFGKDLQIEFFKHWKGKKTAPFYNLSEKETDDLLNQAIRRSERYRLLKEDEMPEDSIMLNFNTPAEMTVFSYKGEIDTVMTPKDSIRYYKHFLQTGFLSMDPHTGHIKAWVGGINYKHFKYDHVKQGKRQVGSTFKPFVYALAMQENYSPCYQIPNQRVCFDLPEGGSWCPENSDDEYNGQMMSLKKGLALSQNYITAAVMKMFGPQAVIDLVRKMGITSHIDAVPSICLGTADLSVYEIVGANATFANKGVWTEPVFITRIEDKNGIILQDFSPRRVEAMSEESAYLTLNLMQGVVEHGTGMRLRFKYKLTAPIAGKTGTTQNNSDGWFIGLTPDLVSGVWAGCEDRSAHFRSMQFGQGATMALPIFAKYMQKIYADSTLKISQDNFEKPATKISVELDCNKYNNGQNNKKTNSYNNPFD